MNFFPDGRANLLRSKSCFLLVSPWHPSSPFPHQHINTFFFNLFLPPSTSTSAPPPTPPPFPTTLLTLEQPGRIRGRQAAIHLAAACQPRPNKLGETIASRGEPRASPAWVARSVKLPELSGPWPGPPRRENGCRAYGWAHTHTRRCTHRLPQHTHTHTSASLQQIGITVSSWHSGTCFGTTLPEYYSQKHFLKNIL